MKIPSMFANVITVKLSGPVFWDIVCSRLRYTANVCALINISCSRIVKINKMKNTH